MQTGIYQHYKGNLYLILGTALLEDSLESVVIYQALYGDYTLWIREQMLFEEHIDIPKYNYSGPRFRFKSHWTHADALKHPRALSPFPITESAD